MPLKLDPQTAAGIAHCRNLARAHYENFPVASWLLPRAARDAVAVIYAFARHADDIADEGDLGDEARLQALAQLRGDLHDCVPTSATAGDPMLAALATVVREHDLPMQAFDDLLDAFEQDVTVRAYDDFGALMGYCRRSANPIGRLLLRLSGQDNARNCALSDAICSALQLINFIQDLHSDLTDRGRCYIPLDEMQKFGVDRDDLLQRPRDDASRRLVEFQINRARRLLQSGAELGQRLPGRFGLEIRAIIAGGGRILDRLAARDSVLCRPTLSWPDRLFVVWTALRNRSIRPQGH